MTNLYHEALTALLSGITTRKNEKEIWWKDEDGDPITVEGTGEENWVVREYYENGQKWWETNYGPQGQRHGKDIGWHENGQKRWEVNYHQGQLHGKSIGWWENGQKKWETDYYQGQRHGKNSWWWEAEQVRWE